MQEKSQIQAQVAQAVSAVRAQNPLAGSITNTVTVNLVANAQIAVGGSAAMVYLPDEAEGLAAISGALYLNMGTLFPIYEQTIPRAAAACNKAGKPFVVDPVGIGLGSLREKLLVQLKDCKPAIIRCNASEAIALAELWDLDAGTADANVRGVDSTDSVEQARAAAIALARFTGGAVAVSGVVDLVTDGKTVVRSHGGSHFMGKITGAGCALGGVAAIYACVASPFTAALAATQMFNAAASQAEGQASGPGSFQARFLDALYALPAQNVAANPFDIEEA